MGSYSLCLENAPPIKALRHTRLFISETPAKANKAMLKTKYLNTVIILTLSIAIGLNINLLSQLDIYLLAYALCIIILIFYYKYPYWCLVVAFAIKPTIDLFWMAKTKGLISPLFIFGVTIPLVAMWRRKQIISGFIRSKHDKIVAIYLLIMGLITLLKIILIPAYWYNSIDGYFRILSVTIFFFIGKYYFRSISNRKNLAWAIVLSVIIPFLLTFMLKIGINSNAQSNFFVGSRHGIERISGAYSGVYELAFLGMVSSLVIFSFMTAKDRFPKFFYILLALSLYFLYFTYSRSAWLLFIFSIVLYCFFNKNFKYLLFILTAIILMYLYIPNVQYRFEDELGFFIGKSSFNNFGYSRGRVWLIIIEKFKNQDLIYQLIGNYGLGNAENQFLGTLIWYGYFGLLSFISLICYMTFFFIKNNH